MSFLMILLLSSFEYLAIIFLMLVIFNLSFMGFIPHTIFIALFMAHVSYSFTQIGLDKNGVSIILQCLLFGICVWLLYRINIFYALFTGIASYFLYAGIQVCIFMILVAIGFMTAQDLIPLTFKHSVLQIISIIVPMVLSFTLYRIKARYNFVPTSEFVKVKLKGINLVVMISMISTILVSCITYYFIKQNQTHIWLIVSVVQFLFVGSMLYLSGKKEVQYRNGRRKMGKGHSAEN